MISAFRKWPQWALGGASDEADFRMIEAVVQNLGYAGLFLASFLSATLIPLSSEGAVALMAGGKFNPVMILTVATIGNSLGALVNYLVGIWGGRFLFSRYIKIKDSARIRAERTYGRWGAPILFFSWLPVVGDPLTLAAGVLRVNPVSFLLWVVAGKAFRYWAILWGVGILAP